MKQNAISYLSTEKENLNKLSKYLYNNPEESYKEFKACAYLTEFLEHRGFNIEKNFQSIPTAFKAIIGNGHPVICFTCEYDAIPDKGHLTAHNLICQTQIGAAISLAHILNKLKKEGTIIVLGCPGEYLGGSKEVFLRQGVFDDIDVILNTQANIITCESGTSASIIPLQINITSDFTLSLENTCKYSALDATLAICNILNTLEKGLNCENPKIDYTINESTKDPFIKSNNSIIKILIRSKTKNEGLEIKETIKSIAEFISKLLNVQIETSLYQTPSEPLNSNKTLSRLFSHNLKESGIIDINPSISSNDGIGLGGISHLVPTINPLIAITKEKVNYASLDFAKLSLTDEANEISFKISSALICTSLDLIEKEELLIEAKQELKN